jgi:hypothetical protein
VERINVRSKLLIREGWNSSYGVARNVTLKKHGLDRSKYNQIANYVYMQSEINIKVGNKPPKDYFEIITTQMLDNNKQVSGLSTNQELLDNLNMNAVPAEIMQMRIDDYNDFLTTRRKLMATKIKEYYHSL